MAINPMQRRSNTALMLGVLIGLIITVIVAGVLYLQINKKDQELKKEKKARQTVEVAKRDIKANEEIKEEDFEVAKVITGISQNNIVTRATISELNSKQQSTDTKNNNQNNTKKSANVFEVDGKKTKQSFSGLLNNQENKQNNNQNNTQNNTQNTSTTDTQTNVKENAIIAKINIPKGTIITKDMVSKKTSDIQKKDTERIIEYNMISLPSNLAEHDTIDVRLALPNGQDYIVLSKKTVEKTDANSVWLKASEDEISTMSSAIIDSYILEGAKLYAVSYSDPGIQKATKAFYPSNAAVAQLMKNGNPNISKSVKDEVYQGSVRQTIEQIILQNNKNEEKNTRINAGVQKDIKTKEEKRKKYLEELNGTEEQ